MWLIPVEITSTVICPSPGGGRVRARFSSTSASPCLVYSNHWASTDVFFMA